MPRLQPLLTVWAGSVTINILPDDVLLLIFYFDGLEDSEWWCISAVSWHRLVHVCKRWRSVVFASPNFLGLRLTWTCAENIGIWPPLPIVIWNGIDWLKRQAGDGGFDVLLDAATVHRSRIWGISLYLTSRKLQRLASAMQEEFPALTHLTLNCPDSPLPALPDGFLGGSAPRLRSLELRYIPFPALPKLLLSATGLIHLKLWNIPHFEYIFPEKIIIALAMLVNLKSLTIRFKFPLSRLDSKNLRQAPLTRSVLPALECLDLEGMNEQLEDLVVRIDAPILYEISVKIFDQLDQPIFDTQQLAQFIGRTPDLKTLEESHITCFNHEVHVELSSPLSKLIRLEIPLRESDLQLSFLMSSLPPLTTVERLYIRDHRHPNFFDDHWTTKNTRWLELSHPFTALKELHVVFEEFVPPIIPVLHTLVGKRVIETLPALQNIFFMEFELSGPIQEAIQQLVTARRLSGHPLTVHIGEHKSTGCQLDDTD